MTKKDKYLASAQKLLERGSLDKALAEFLKAAQEDQKDTRTWLRIAEIHVKRGEATQATQVYLKTAELYVEQGFFQRAVAVYKNVLKLTPGHTDAHFKLADVYKQLGLFSDAAQQYDQAATAFHRAGRLKDAISALAQIVEMNPDQVMSRVRLAELQAQAGNNEDAGREFSRAAEQLEEQGRLDDYLRVGERLLALQPENFPLARKLAVRHLERQNPKAALAKLQPCYSADDKDADTLSLLANTFEQLGQTDKTLSVLKQLAKVYEDRRMQAERGQTIQRILSIDPSDALGNQRKERGREDRSPAGRDDGMNSPRKGATITFSELDVQPPATHPRPQPPTGSDGSPDLTELEREQTQAEIRRILTETDLFVKFGLNERAAEHVRKVFSLRPDHTGAHERLIAVLAQLGRKAEAIEELGILADRLLETDRPGAERHLRRALELDPHAAGARRMLDRLEGEGSVEKAVPDLEESIELELPEGGPPDHGARAGRTGRGADLSSGWVSEQPIETRAPAGEAASEWEDLGDPASDDGFEEITSRPSSEVASSSDESVPGLDLRLGGSPSPAPSPRRPTPPPVRPQHAPDKPGGVENHAAASFDEFEIDLEAATPVPEVAVATPPPAAGPPPLDPNVASELDQVDFFLDQGLVEEGRGLLDEISPVHANHPEVWARRQRLNAIPVVTPEPANAPAAPAAHISWDPGEMEGAVPGGPFVEMSGDSRGEPTHITPRAVVPAGAPDSTTQRDLGIAYKEMGLYDAAVAEFNKLVDDPEHEVFALTMMGECFESRGTPSEALIHYKRALNRPQVLDEEATQLYYQLGRVFHTLGDESEALYFFEKVARRSPKHEDVAQRIAALRAQGVAPIPSTGGGSAEERPRFDAARGSTGNRR